MDIGYQRSDQMKSRHIERKIRTKMLEWWASIEDESVQKLAQKGSIVTGGAIVSMLRNEKPNDYDVYFKDLETTKAIAEYYIEKFNAIPNNAVSFGETSSAKNVETFVWIKEYEDETQPSRVMISVKSAGIAGAGQGDKSEYQYFETVTDEAEQSEVVEDYIAAATDIGDDDIPPFVPTFVTSNAISLSGDVQLVIRFYGKPSEIHENFDFEHCKSYWRSWANKFSALTLRKSSLIAIMTNELIYSGGSKYPLASLFRLRKFMKRDWYYSLGTMLKIVFDIKDLDLSDPDVLEEQLVGMDVAYFLEVIEKMKEDKRTSIDSTYLHQVIDELY